MEKTDCARHDKKLTSGQSADLSNWPEKLIPLCLKHGTEFVHSVGVETLGYPPMWAVGLKPCLAVSAAVAKAAIERESQ